MPSGSDHYQEAERLTAEAKRLPPGAHAQRHALLMEAQVHATLADTAAKIADHIALTFSASEAWREALSDREREPIRGDVEPEAGD
jgi:hypothetical protein